MAEWGTWLAMLVYAYANEGSQDGGRARHSNARPGRRLRPAPGGVRGALQTTFAEAVEFVLSRPQVIPNHLAIIASGVAHTTAPENLRAAARLRGAITALRTRRTWHDDPRNLDVDSSSTEP